MTLQPHMTAALASTPASHATTLGVLAAFVAINTLMYVSLALIKTAPRLRIAARLRRHYVRAETRSIYPAPGATGGPSSDSTGA